MPSSEFNYRSDNERPADNGGAHEADPTPVMGIKVIDVENYRPSFGERIDSMAARIKDRWEQTDKTRMTIKTCIAAAFGIAATLAVITITNSNEEEPSDESTAVEPLPSTTAPGSPPTTIAPAVVDQVSGIDFVVVSAGGGQSSVFYQCELMPVDVESGMSHNSSTEHFLAYNSAYFTSDNQQLRSQRASELLNGMRDSFDVYEEVYGLTIQQVPVLNGNFPNVSYEEPLMDIRNCQVQPR